MFSVLKNKNKICGVVFGTWNGLIVFQLISMGKIDLQNEQIVKQAW